MKNKTKHRVMSIVIVVIALTVAVIITIKNPATLALDTASMFDRIDDLKNELGQMDERMKEIAAEVAELEVSLKMLK